MAEMPQFEVTYRPDEKREFMRAYVLAMARAGTKVIIETDAPLLATRARWAWDAIEQEAGKP